MATQHVNSNSFSKNADRVEGTVKSAVDSTREQAQHLMEEAKSYAETGTKVARDKYKDVENVVKDKSEYLADYIKEQPIKSVVIALGVGYFLNSICKK